MDVPITAEVFLPHTGKAFRVRGGRHELTLKSVDLQPVEGWDPKVVPHRPFTLIFSGPPRDVLGQGMYTFEVADGPQFDIYVIPVRTHAPTRQDYQAVFN
jgi:hypothetical protein